jgi:hypothetical protein
LLDYFAVFKHLFWVFDAVEFSVDLLLIEIILRGVAIAAHASLGLSVGLVPLFDLDDLVSVFKFGFFEILTPVGFF